MSTIRIRYAHAAPEIRKQIVYAVRAWQTAKTQIAIARCRAEANGLRLALEIMYESDDVADVPGIAEEDRLPEDALEATRKWLGEDAEKLGFAAAKPVESAVCGKPGHPDFEHDCKVFATVQSHYGTES